jgi:hypothetical protein
VYRVQVSKVAAYSNTNFELTIKSQKGPCICEKEQREESVPCGVQFIVSPAHPQPLYVVSGTMLEAGDTRTPSFCSSGFAEADGCSEDERATADFGWRRPESIKDERVFTKECIACSCRVCCL